MNRLDQTMRKAKRTGRKLFCAYITLGYPDLSFTKQLVSQLEHVGVDILELGFPFSDPLADGPVIQEASTEALARGIKIEDAFRLVQKCRREGVRFPILFFTYYNPVLRYGLKRFCQKLKTSGFDGVLCPDLPPDEEKNLPQLLQKNGLAHVYLIAPTSTAERIRKIDRASRPFIYYVSRRGVTGVQKRLGGDLASKLKQLRRTVSQPVLVGFGVSKRDQVQQIIRYSGGVIVGSAIIRWIKQFRSPRRVAKEVGKLVRYLR